MTLPRGPRTRAVQSGVFTQQVRDDLGMQLSSRTLSTPHRLWGSCLPACVYMCLSLCTPITAKAWFGRLSVSPGSSGFYCQPWFSSLRLSAVMRFFRFDSFDSRAVSSDCQSWFTPSSLRLPAVMRLVSLQLALTVV